MRYLLAMLLVLAPIATCSASPPQDFRAAMMARLHQAMPDATLTADPADPLVINIKGGAWEEGQINLHRLNGYCQQATASDCERSKAEFAARIAVKPAKASAASLRLIVRDREYLAYVEETAAKSPDKGDFAKHRQIGEDLFAFLAADSKESIALVGDTTLKELGLTADAAWALAEAQTRAILPALPDPAKLATGPIVFQDKEYLASLLIDLPGWAAVAAKAGPDLFVTVVADGLVFVGQGPDGPGLDQFKQAVAADCATQQRCVSPHLYRFRDGRWVIAK